MPQFVFDVAGHATVCISSRTFARLIKRWYTCLTTFSSYQARLRSELAMSVGSSVSKRLGWSTKRLPGAQYSTLNPLKLGRAQLTPSDAHKFDRPSTCPPARSRCPRARISSNGSALASRPAWPRSHARSLAGNASRLSVNRNANVLRHANSVAPLQQSQRNFG